MQDFQKLEVWQQAFDFTLKIYKATGSFPSDERFGITSQLRRAASSICANISEGCGRQSQKDFLRFLFVAMGSAKECQSFLLLSQKLGYLSDGSLHSEADLIAKRLNCFIKAVQKQV